VRWEQEQPSTCPEGHSTFRSREITDEIEDCIRILSMDGTKVFYIKIAANGIFNVLTSVLVSELE